MIYLWYTCVLVSYLNFHNTRFSKVLWLCISHQQKSLFVHPWPTNQCISFIKTQMVNWLIYLIQRIVGKNFFSYTLICVNLFRHLNLNEKFLKQNPYTKCFKLASKEKFARQTRCNKGCLKFKIRRRVQKRLVSTWEHMQVPRWNRTRCMEKSVSPVKLQINKCITNIVPVLFLHVPKNILI